MKTILVAPLNWGMGHATRCIPIIRELLTQKQKVVLASDGRAFHLLKQEFPELPIIELPGYGITYPTGDKMILKISQQLPKILYTAYQEQQQLKSIIETYRIDAIISDNRFGLYSDKIPCVFISHQLNILPERDDLLSFTVKKLNFSYISRFNECWIPDYNGHKSLTGKMIVTLPKIQCEHIGILSRFEPKHTALSKFDVLVVLSGPEPQRTLLENILLKQLSELKLKVTFVRGITETSNYKKIGDIEMYDHLTSKSLKAAFAESEIIISRTGHTTVMDLIVMDKKGLLIPTPGQPEQVYLGHVLNEKGFFCCVEQDNVNLAVDLLKAQSMQYKTPKYNTSHYKTVLKKWIKKIQA